MRPGNTLDGNYATRWSNNHNGGWIQYDLGSVHSVNALRLAWYKGSRRKAKFDVLVGETPTSLQQVLTGVSACGATEGLETYAFAATKARYVRVVGHGNSLNSWNSIVEAVIRGTKGGGSATCQSIYGVVDGYQLCDETATACEFNAKLKGNKNCNDICGQYGGQCLAQYGNGSGGCSRSGQKSCGSTGKWDDICRCTK